MEIDCHVIGNAARKVNFIGECAVLPHQVYFLKQVLTSCVQTMQASSCVLGSSQQMTPGGRGESNFG